MSVLESIHQPDVGALLQDRIENTTAKVGVVGLDYVGLPLAVEVAQSGLEVTGIDGAALPKRQPTSRVDDSHFIRIDE